MENHLDYIPQIMDAAISTAKMAAKITEQQEQIRKLTDRLMSCTVHLQAACYFISKADQDFKDKFLAEIEESKKILGI